MVGRIALFYPEVFWCVPVRSPGFATEFEGGHGSHTAGTAAGVMLDSPDELECGDGEELGCLGGCFDSDVLDAMVEDTTEVDIEVFCPAHDCDGFESDFCLDDGPEMLAANGGVAPGAKISVFDVISDDSLTVWAFLAENGLWEAAEETGCKVHSNSWGTTELNCEVDAFSVAFDTYMYEVGFLNVCVEPRSSIHPRALVWVGCWCLPEANAPPGVFFET